MRFDRVVFCFEDRSSEEMPNLMIELKYNLIYQVNRKLEELTYT
jgi:hypothetical protein